MRKRREETLDEGFDLPDTPGNEDDDRLPKVMEYVDSMHEPVRTIILLFYTEDRPIKEIAAILDMPVNTVKVYLKRGRDKLKQQFSNTSELYE